MPYFKLLRKCQVAYLDYVGFDLLWVHSISEVQMPQLQESTLKEKLKTKLHTMRIFVEPQFNVLNSCRLPKHERNQGRRQATQRHWDGCVLVILPWSLKSRLPTVQTGLT